VLDAATSEMFNGELSAERDHRSVNSHKPDLLFASFSKNSTYGQLQALICSTALRCERQNNHAIFRFQTFGIRRSPCDLPGANQECPAAVCALAANRLDNTADTRVFCFDQNTKPSSFAVRFKTNLLPEFFELA